MVKTIWLFTNEIPYSQLVQHITEGFSNKEKLAWYFKFHASPVTIFSQINYNVILFTIQWLLFC